MSRRTQKKVLSQIISEKVKPKVDLVMTAGGYAAVEKPAVKKAIPKAPVSKKRNQKPRAKNRRG